MYHIQLRPIPTPNQVTSMAATRRHTQGVNLGAPQIAARGTSPQEENEVAAFHLGEGLGTQATKRSEQGQCRLLHPQKAKEMVREEVTAQ